MNCEKYKFMFKYLINIIKQILFIIYTYILIFTNCYNYIYEELFYNLQIFGYKKLNFNEEFFPTNDDKNKLNEKVCLITGGTSGIGLEVIKFLLKNNISKIITGTSKLNQKNFNDNDINMFKENFLKKNNLQNYDKNLIIYPLDLSSMESVCKFSEKILNSEKKIDYFICNGGIMVPSSPLTTNNNGLFDLTMATNYYGHCLLIIKSLKLLKNSNIIIVSSAMHHAIRQIRFNDLQLKNLYAIYYAYAQSKLALIMFTYRFNRWIKDNFKNKNEIYLKINSLHPGICRTHLFFNVWQLKNLPIYFLKYFSRTAEEGTETILYLSLSNQMKDCTGKYFENCMIKKSSKISYDENLQQKLWLRTWQDLRPWLTIDEYNRLIKCLRKKNLCGQIYE